MTASLVDPRKALGCFLRDDLGDNPPRYDRAGPVLVTNRDGEIVWDRGRGSVTVPLMAPDARDFRQWYASLDEFLNAKAYSMLVLAADRLTWRGFFSLKPKGRDLLVPDPECLGRYVVARDGRVGLLLHNPSAVSWI